MTTLTTGPNADARAAGLTLLELTLVMVIICTVLGMAAVSLRGFFASRQTADAAAQIVALTQYARGQAAVEGCIYRLNISTSDAKYWLTRQSAGAYEAPASEFGRVFRLPERTNVEWVETVVDSTDEESESWIAFHPDGRCDARTLLLTGRNERMYVQCDSPAESYHVVAAEDDL